MNMKTADLGVMNINDIFNINLCKRDRRPLILINLSYNYTQIGL